MDGHFIFSDDFTIDRSDGAREQKNARPIELICLDV